MPSTYGARTHPAAGFGRVFDYFADPSRFPDGATFLLNTQYSPCDGCRSPYDPVSSQATEGLLQEVNRRVFLDTAQARADAIAVDHYPDWRGHVSHSNESDCFCRGDNTRWVMSDGVHPNELGYAHIAKKWETPLEGMLGVACVE